MSDTYNRREYDKGYGTFANPYRWRVASSTGTSELGNVNEMHGRHKNIVAGILVSNQNCKFIDEHGVVCGTRLRYSIIGGVTDITNIIRNLSQSGIMKYVNIVFNCKESTIVVTIRHKSDVDEHHDINSEFNVHSKHVTLATVMRYTTLLFKVIMFISIIHYVYTLITVCI